MTTITPLKKQGRHGGLIAVLLLTATTVVVWSSRPREPSWEPTAPPRAAVVPRSSSTMPGAVAEITPRPGPSLDHAKTVDQRWPLIATGATYYDETRTSHVGVPVAGWLKKTRAKSLGRTVRSGETLGILYSPEVYLTTASVVKQVRTFEGQAPLDADRWKLLRWGMLQPTLTRIEATQKPQAALPLVARVSGTVVAETASPAQLVDPSIEPDLFTVTDPAYVWIYIDVPDAYAAELRVGALAKLTIAGIARPMTAKIARVFRFSEDGMRKVKFEVHSPRILLEPNLLVTAELGRPDRAP